MRDTQPWLCGRITRENDHYFVYGSWLIPCIFQYIVTHLENVYYPEGPWFWAQKIKIDSPGLTFGLQKSKPFTGLNWHSWRTLFN